LYFYSLTYKEDLQGIQEKVKIMEGMYFSWKRGCAKSNAICIAFFPAIAIINPY
jgi:hypothetical protein